MILENRETGDRISSKALDRRLGRMRRRFNAWGKVVDRWDKASYRMMLVRLSYRPGECWAPNDVRDYMLELRSVVGSSLVAYAWVAERTVQAGVLHYHVYLVLRRGHDDIPHADSSGMWVKGSSNLQEVRERRGWRYLISGYGAKLAQKDGEFPKGMRMYSCWIKDGMVEGVELIEYRISVLPKWLAVKVLEVWMARGEWHHVLWPYRDEFGQWWVGKRRVESPWMVVSAVDWS